MFSYLRWNGFNERASQYYSHHRYHASQLFRTSNSLRAYLNIFKIFDIFIRQLTNN